MNNLYKIDQDTQIDEFDVDHSKFSLRDEIEYNKMRADERDALSTNNSSMARYPQLTQNILPQMQEKYQPDKDFYIRDDKNYAWNLPHKYDRRPNLAGTFNNFMKINQEHPVQKPITTGNIVGDYHLMQSIAKISPVVRSAVWGANVGSILGGYIGNLKRAYDEAHLFENDNQYKNFILQEQ